MELKYQAQLRELENCPPADAYPSNGKAFRFVHENIQHPNNFLPVAVIQPSRQLPKKVRCESWGLSLFETEEGARERYRQVCDMVRNFPKLVGDCLAEGNLTAADGVRTPASESSHFTLHEYTGTDFASKFSIVGRLL